MLTRRILAVLAAVLIGAPAAAQTVTLKLNNPGPPTAALHKKGFESWARAVEADSGGALKIELYAGGVLGGFAVTYDRVIDGVADIGFILTAMAGGKLRQQDVAALPFEANTSIEAAVALWRLYELGVTAEEFSQVKPLGFWTFPNAALHTRVPVSKLEDLRGKRLTASSAMAGKIVRTLGATPLTFRPDEVFQAISRALADGALMPFTGMGAFKINETTRHHLDAALGGDAAVLFMNGQRYASLPPRAKAAIDKHSYLPLSEKLGQVNHDYWHSAREIVKDRIVTLDAAEEKRWRQALAPIAEEWVRTTPGGAKVLQTFREEIAAYRARTKNKP